MSKGGYIHAADNAQPLQMPDMSALQQLMPDMGSLGSMIGAMSQQNPQQQSMRSMTPQWQGPMPGVAPQFQMQDNNPWNPQPMPSQQPWISAMNQEQTPMASSLSSIASQAQGRRFQSQSANPVLTMLMQRAGL